MTTFALISRESVTMAAQLSSAEDSSPSTVKDLRDMLWIAPLAMWPGSVADLSKVDILLPRTNMCKVE